MGISVEFFTFSKNPNSTKQPSGDGTIYSCNLIEPCSIVNPVIALAIQTKPYGFNYAKIPEFGRFYFVNDWTYSGGRWIATLNVDVLASWKSYIGSKTQYVLRSSARRDGNIIDTLYPTKNNVYRSVSEASYMEGGGFKYSFNEGAYVVGIINDDSGAIGCVSYYAFTNSAFRAFCSKLLGTTDWMYDGIDEISLELTKVLFNPFQYIASCMWIPLNIGGSGGSVKYGWWDLGVGGARISGNSYAVGANFTIPKHPQSGRGQYLNGAPFSRYYLDWPCFGRIALDANILKDFDSLNCNIIVDPVSGIGTLRVSPGAIPIYTQQSQIGVPVQLAQMAVNYGGVASSVASGISSALNLDVAGMFNSIGNACESAMPQLSTTGKNGSISAFKYNPMLCAEFYEVVDDDNAHLGRPLCIDIAPQSIPGYMVCADVEIDAPCSRPENDSIVSYMEGGFYYE